MPRRSFGQVFGVVFYALLGVQIQGCADSARHQPPVLKLETLVGATEVSDPAARDLLQSKVMERIKFIDQSGTPAYFYNQASYSRYDHSVAVYALLKRFGVSREEQLAGLLHDASHTVFSHLGDQLFGKGDGKNAYQDDIHGWYLKEMDVEPMLARHGLRLDDVLAKQDHFTALEQDLPELCADRIEYILHRAFVEGELSKVRVAEIIEDLRFKDGRWYFTTVASAKQLALLSIQHTTEVYGHMENMIIYHWSAQMVRRAIELGLLTRDQMHFGTDREVLNVLVMAKDPMIQDLLTKCRNPSRYAVEVTDEPFDLLLKTKFRGVDPLVWHQGQVQRLSHIDAAFRKVYEANQKRVAQGHKVRFLNPS
ncbi:MAG: hypothetical protein ACK5O7_02125 [Holosporales bacterium]